MVERNVAYEGGLQCNVQSKQYTEVTFLLRALMFLLKKKKKLMVGNKRVEIKIISYRVCIYTFQINVYIHTHKHTDA